MGRLRSSLALMFALSGFVVAASLRADEGEEKPAAAAEQAAAKDHAAGAKAAPETPGAGDSPKNEASGKTAEQAGETADAAADVGHDDENEHGGAHHDPYDLSHQNAGPDMENPAEFKSDLAIWSAVVFFCLLAVLLKFAWGPVVDGLDRREQSIAAMIDEAKQGQEQAAERLKEYEAQLATAGEEARAIVAQARKDAEATGERLRAEARESAERERERAVADITTAKNAALQDITDKSVDLAVQLAGRIVRRELNAQDHSQLIREAVEQLPSRT